MNKIERRGPYYIERNEDFVIIRCSYPFHVIRTREDMAVQSGKEWITRPLTQTRGTRLTLCGQGLPEEVIEYPGGGDAA